MKTFARHKTSDEVRKACALAGYLIDTSDYSRGGDHIRVRFVHEDVAFIVMFNTVNGRFFGHPAGVGTEAMFTSDDDGLDGEPWFDALLDFFYVPKEED